MTRRFDTTIIDLIESTAKNFKAMPVNLGGYGGAGGGVGGPPGGFIGRLPQYQVAYDVTEAATLDTMSSGLIGASGWSLVDNLNHIRARLNVVESGILIVDDWDGSPTVRHVHEITFSGAIVTDLGGGHALVTFSGGGIVGSGGGDMLKSVYDTDNDGMVDVSKSTISLNGYPCDELIDPNGGDFLVYTLAQGWIAQHINYAQYFTDLGDTPSSLTGQGRKFLRVNSDGNAIEFAPFVVEEWDGSPSVSNVDRIVFSGASVTNLGSGKVLIIASGGGGGDSTYLRLDAANDPVTGPLEINLLNNVPDNYGVIIVVDDAINNPTAALKVENKRGQAIDSYGHNRYDAYFNQIYNGAVALGYANIYGLRYSEDSVGTNVFLDYQIHLEDDSPHAVFSGGTLIHQYYDGTYHTLADINPFAYSGGAIATFDSHNPINSAGRLLSLKNQSTEKFCVTGSGLVNIPGGQTYNINGTPHTHTGNVIYSEDVTLVAGTFDFQNIPATGSLIEIIFEGRSDRVGQNSDGAKIKFNNDGGNNYIGVIQWGGATPGWTQQSTAGAPIVFTYTPAAISPANWFSNSKIIIPNYASSHYKDWQARGMQIVTTGGNTWIYDAAGSYLSTTAISRVTIYPENGTNFANGSRATLRVYA